MNHHQHQNLTSYFWMYKWSKLMQAWEFLPKQVTFKGVHGPEQVGLRHIKAPPNSEMQAHNQFNPERVVIARSEPTHLLNRARLDFAITCWGLFIIYLSKFILNCKHNLLWLGWAGVFSFLSLKLITFQLLNEPKLKIQDRHKAGWAQSGPIWPAHEHP